VSTETLAHESAAGHHDSEHNTGHDGANGHSTHHPSDWSYVVIFGILVVITAAEVALSYMDVGRLFLPVLLILMAIKFVTVVSYFMHLKFDNKLFSFLFYSGLGLAVAVYIAALTTSQFWTK
jgi:cytochrome c oxidase subunit 4